MTTALRIDDVVVTAGSIRLLDGVSLSVEPGRIVVVVGANGAGKTTLLDAVCGLVHRAHGAVVLAGDGNRHGPIGRAFQGSPLPATMTVAEVAALVAGGRRPGLDLIERFGLRDHASSFVAELSTGMRRILDVAVATVRHPPVLLLDEPASGLAQAEVEQLADLLLSWRDTSGAAILLVEHDLALVRRVADEVVVLSGGRVVAHGTPDEVLDTRAAAQPRVRKPGDERFRTALTRVVAEAEPAAPLVRRALSTWTLLRLGLREFAAGIGSVLILGVLNRVMKVELGISLLVVAAVLASYNLAAPFALAVGHRSDVRPIAGRRRAPYIFGGSIVTGLAVAGAPHVADQLAGGISPLAILLAVALFVAMGIGMYGSGAVFFALLADMAPEAERGHAASIVYLELMAGILAGVALTAVVLDGDAGGLNTLFALAGVLIVALTAIAVWGQEGRVARSGAAQAPSQESFRRALRGIASIGQARRFFTFMVVSTLFLFLQQAVLEPFGGDVLDLDVRATSAFNALHTIGILTGMLVAGRAAADRVGQIRMATVGLIAAAVGFAGLAAAAATHAAPPTWLAILGIGLATGVFNVATLALMMGMADQARAALFMGAWTVAHAVAVGLATAGGGVVYEVARRVVDSVAGGYATVFALEAVGLALSLPLLRRIQPERFAAEAEMSTADLEGG